MPIFDYRCRDAKCPGKRDNVLVYTGRLSPACPVCKKRMVRIWTVGMIGIQGDLPGINIRKKREKESHHEGTKTQSRKKR